MESRDRAIELECPACHRRLLAPAEAGEEFLCPYCGQPVPVVPEPAHNQDELDGLRIHRLAGLRRTAWRSRSYCLIGVAGCVVGATELIWDAVGRLGNRTGSGWAITELLIAALLLPGGFRLARCAAVFDKRAREPLAHERQAPSAPPDFSRLGDGSQKARDLDRL